MITAPQRNIVSRGHADTRNAPPRAPFACVQRSFKLLRGSLAAPRSPTSSAAFRRTLGRRKDLLIKILSAAGHRSDALTPVLGSALPISPCATALSPQQ